MKEKKKIKTNFTKMIGIVTDYDEPKKYTPKNKKPFNKMVLTIKIEDGQVFFGELRNRRIALMKNIKKNDNVKVKFSLLGSKKNNIKYNNIYIEHIEKYIKPGEGKNKSAISFFGKIPNYFKNLFNN